MLADQPHMLPSSTQKLTITYCNWAFAFIFLVEMLLKWVATGLVKSKTPPKYRASLPYFYSGWNWLDFFIVIVSLISLSDAQAIKPLRVCRALRPLRLVSRYEDLKITVNTLFKSIPAMGSLMSVALLFFIIFGILGVELYAGRFGYCMDPLYSEEPYGSRVLPGMNGNQNDYQECMDLPRYNLTRRTTHGILFTDMADMFPDASPNWLEFSEFPQWFYPQFGYFDNLKLSLAMLFEISALEGWPDVMHWAMDTDANNLFVVPWRVGSDVGGGLGGVNVPMDVHEPQIGITAIFFMFWIVVGCFVVVNMTVGVVVDTFSQIKAENDGLLLMSEEAADWVKAQKTIFAQRPLVHPASPKEGWRLNVYYLVTSTKFEVTIMVIIILNMLQMGCDWWEPAIHEVATPQFAAGSPNAPYMPVLKEVMRVFNFIFLAIYLLEMTAKWIGLGFYQYFKNAWDCFDFILVVVSTFEAFVSIIGSVDGNAGGSYVPFPPTIIRVLRLFRVIRLLRVVKTAKQLRTIIATVIISLPQLKNIMILILLLILIFDVLLTERFYAINYTPGNFDTDKLTHATALERGEVMPLSDSYYWSDDGTNWGDQINRHANFAYFWTGALTLVRSSTGESFNGIMHDLYDYNWGHNRLTCCPQCGPILPGVGPEVTYNIPLTSLDTAVHTPGSTVVIVQPETSCGQTWLAVIVYGVFQLVMAYIVLSIMIGVILENFANVGSETRKIRVDDIEEFREVWLKYDPKGTFVVPSHNLLAILQQLKEPLGIAGAQPAMTRAEMLKHLGKLDIPDHGGFIHFSETLTAIAFHEAGVPIPLCDTTKKVQKVATKMSKLGKHNLDAPAHNALTNYLVSLLRTDKEKEVDSVATSSPPQQPTHAPQKIKANQVAPEPSAS